MSIHRVHRCIIGEHGDTEGPVWSLPTVIDCGQEHVFYLGPHAPHLTAKEFDLLHGIWLELSKELAPEEIHHHDIVHFALNDLRRDRDRPKRADTIGAVPGHLQDIKGRRVQR